MHLNIGPMSLLADLPGALLQKAFGREGATDDAAAARWVLFAGPAWREREPLGHGEPVAAHWRASYVPEAEDAARACAQLAFDAVVLDFAGLRPTPAVALARLRGSVACPLLVLAQRADDIDEIVALEHGADDFAAWPMSPRRLVARLAAACRGRQPATARPAGTVSPPPAPGPWRLRREPSTLRHGLDRLLLTPLQQALLEALLQRPGQLFTHAELARQLGLRGAEVEPASIAVYVHRLRRRLHAAGALGLRIDAVRGRGFVAQAAPEGAAAQDHQNLYCALT